MANMPTIEATEKAVARIKELIDTEHPDADGVRVSVRGGGCSGLSYELDFENTERTGDKIFEHPSGIRIYTDVKSFLYLAGTTLDFSDGLNGKGFVFSNPNARNTCGCGESFSI